MESAKTYLCERGTLIDPPEVARVGQLTLMWSVRCGVVIVIARWKTVPKKRLSAP